jgi:hypothetical protein
MNATNSHSKTSLTVTHVLAELLERLEHSPVPVGPEQYRSVVLHLIDEFDEVEQSAELRALLDTHPAAAELYENVNYQYAGLCRSALDASLASEKLAADVIARARQPKNSTAAAGLPDSAPNPPPSHSIKEDPQNGKS